VSSLGPIERARRALVADITSALRHPHPAIATVGLSPLEAVAVASGLVDVVGAIPAWELAATQQNVACLLHDRTRDDDARQAFDTLLATLNDAAVRCGVPADVIAQAMGRARAR